MIEHKTAGNVLDPQRGARSTSLKFIGGESRGGAYVLRIHVNKKLVMSFGKFNGGKMISVEAGEYLYVGSAMSQRGSTCLANRLVRHATRLGDHPSHPIRNEMLTQFPKAGMCDVVVRPNKPKLPKWNVDHLLDKPCATLMGAYLARSHSRAEASIGKFLEMDAATAVFEAGLGANDIKQNTHLLRVEASEQWWLELPKKLRTITTLARVHGDRVVHAALIGVEGARQRLTHKQLGKLTRMRHERAADILRRLARGDAYTRADRDSQGIYDTTGWGEVMSRLARGRGTMLRAAAILKGRGHDIVCTQQQKDLLGDLAKQLTGRSEDLRLTTAHIAGSNSSRLVDLTHGLDHGKPVSFNQLAGKIKQCLKFVVKNLLDAPLIEEKVGVGLTTSQWQRIDSELTQIARAATYIFQMCDDGHSNGLASVSVLPSGY